VKDYNRKPDTKDFRRKMNYLKKGQLNLVASQKDRRALTDGDYHLPLAAYFCIRPPARLYPARMTFMSGWQPVGAGK